MNQIDWQAFPKVRVLIIGDVMIDRYLHGQANRISPEAPVPVVLLTKTEDRLGGAANVALNVQSLGATVTLCSCIGQDEGGEAFLQLMHSHQLSATAMLTCKERKTTVKTRIVASAQQLLRVDDEMSTDLNAENEFSLSNTIRQLMQRNAFDVIILQDYNKGVLTPAIITQVLDMAGKLNIPVAVDPKDRNFWHYRGVALFKPNLKEISRQYPHQLEASKASLSAASRFIREQLRNRYTMITLSEKGIYIDDEQESILHPTTPRIIADVSGAGDTVISVAAVALALGLSTQQIALLANLAGGQVCEKPGVVTLNMPVLAQEYTDYIGRSA
jgi:rfaE bifunctional protein kinase chain/domain